jgi:hypothetical protein
MLRLISAAKLEELEVAAGPLDWWAIGGGLTGAAQPTKIVASKNTNRLVFTAITSFLKGEV